MAAVIVIVVEVHRRSSTKKQMFFLDFTAFQRERGPNMALTERNETASRQAFDVDAGLKSSEW